MRRLLSILALTLLLVVGFEGSNPQLTEANAVSVTSDSSYIYMRNTAFNLEMRYEKASNSFRNMLVDGVEYIVGTPESFWLYGGTQASYFPYSSHTVDAEANQTKVTIADTARSYGGSLVQPEYEVTIWETYPIYHVNLTVTNAGVNDISIGADDFAVMLKGLDLLNASGSSDYTEAYVTTLYCNGNPENRTGLWQQYLSPPWYPFAFLTGNGTGRSVFAAIAPSYGLFQAGQYGEGPTYQGTMFKTLYPSWPFAFTWKPNESFSLNLWYCFASSEDITSFQDAVLRYVPEIFKGKVQFPSSHADRLYRLNVYCEWGVVSNGEVDKAVQLGAKAIVLEPTDWALGAYSWNELKTHFAYAHSKDLKVIVTLDPSRPNAFLPDPEPPYNATWRIVNVEGVPLPHTYSLATDWYARYLNYTEYLIKDLAIDGVWLYLDYGNLDYNVTRTPRLFSHLIRLGVLSGKIQEYFQAYRGCQGFISEARFQSGFLWSENITIQFLEEALFYEYGSPGFSLSKVLRFERLFYPMVMQMLQKLGYTGPFWGIGIGSWAVLYPPEAMVPYLRAGFSTAYGLQIGLYYGPQVYDCDLAWGRNVTERWNSWLGGYYLSLKNSMIYTQYDGSFVLSESASSNGTAFMLTKSSVKPVIDLSFGNLDNFTKTVNVTLDRVKLGLDPAKTYTLYNLQSGVLSSLPSTIQVTLPGLSYCSLAVVFNSALLSAGPYEVDLTNLTRTGDHTFYTFQSQNASTKFTLKIYLEVPSRAVVVVKKNGAAYYDWKKYDNGTVIIKNLSGTVLDVTVIDPHPVIVQIYMIFIAILAAFTAAVAKLRKKLSERPVLAASIFVAAIVILILTLTVSLWLPYLLQSLA